MSDSKLEILFTGRHGNVYSYADGQCDCACASPATDPYVFSLSSNLHKYDSIKLEKRDCIEQEPLSKGYKAFFNTRLGNGVAVLNPKSREFLENLPSAFYITPTKNDIHDLLLGLVNVGILESTGISPLEALIPPELSVFLSITNTCNLSCDYCYVDKGKDHCITENVGYKSIDKSVDAAVLHSYKQVKVKFAGGEPTLALPKVLTLQDYAVARGKLNGIEVHSVILSNGVHFDDATINQLKARDIRIMISLDGVGKYHDAQRRFADGCGSFTYVDRTIQKLIAADLRPMISITVSNRNVEGLAKVTQYVLERNLPFSFNFFRDNPRANNSPDLRLQNEQLITALLQSFEVIASYPPDYSLMSAMIDRTCFSHPHHQACSAGESYFAIDTQGSIAKCPMLLNSPVTSIYAKDPLGDLHNDRATLQQLDVDEKEECRDCKWRYWCAGGCPLLTYRTTGRYDTKSPYCEVYKAVFPELLRLEGLRIMKKSGIL